MPKTFNRKVQEVDIVDYDDLDYQYQNISTSSGINESKNFVSVDQNSLANADNVYINEDGVLSSRPAIKSIEISYISNDTQIIDLINANGIIFYHLLKDNIYSVAFKYNDAWQEHSCSSKLTIAFMSDMFVFFTTNDIFAYTTSGQWQTHEDIFYIPTCIVGATAAEGDNLFVDGELQRTIVTDKTSITWSDYDGKSIRITIDNDTYSITFVNGQQITFARRINTFTANSYKLSKVGNILAYNEAYKPYYYSADGVLFYELPPLPTGHYDSLGNYNNISYSYPIISESGGTIFVLAKYSSGTSIYYIDTASRTAWNFVDSTLHPLNKIVYTPSSGTYSGAEVTTTFTFHTSGTSSTEQTFNRDRLSRDGTIGCANDDDRCVFISLPTSSDADNITTVTVVKRDSSSSSHSTNTFKPAYIHVLRTSGSTLVMDSYCVTVDSVVTHDYEGTTPFDLKLSTDAVTDRSAALIAYQSTEVAWIESWNILFDSDMRPYYTISVVSSNVADHPVLKLYYTFGTASSGSDFGDEPYGINMYKLNDNKIEMHTIQERGIIFACRIRMLSIVYDSDVLASNFTIDSDLGTHEYNISYTKTSDTTTSIYYYDNLTNLNQRHYIIATEDFSVVITDEYIYLGSYEKAYKLLHTCVPLSPSWNDKILYSVNGQLYSNDWTNAIYIDILDVRKYNLVFANHFQQLINDFIAVDNKLYFRTVTADKLLYFSTGNEYSFESKITNLIQLSQTSLAVFLKNSVYIVNYEGVDSESSKPSYTYTKSKLQLGCRDGDDVLLTYDGSTILLPTLKGLTSLSYEQLMINNEQVYSYLSDQLSDLYKDFIDGQIKLYQYKSYIIVYSSVKKYCYIYDLTNQSWWKWSCSKLLSKVVYNDESILLLIDGHVFTLSEDGQYLDFDSEVINWHFVSQKLHFGAPNNYKHIYAISLESSTDVPEDVRYALKCMNYRKSKNVNDAEIFEYNINGIRLYVKRCNYYKSNAFQFELSSAHQDKPKQIKLANIAIKYRITESIR